MGHLYRGYVSHNQMVMKNDEKFQWKIRLILIHGNFSTELPLFDGRCGGRIPHFLATDPCPSHWSWGTQNQQKCMVGGLEHDWKYHIYFFHMG
jgi:hypothetical protein